MEILLLENVAKIGKKNDLLIVGDGFALNFLLPRRLAIVATPTVRKRYAEQIRRRAEEKDMEKKQQAGVAEALSGKTITIKKKATKTGKLYAAISPKTIADAAFEQLKMEVAEDAILIDTPIKSVGSFEITAKIGALSQPISVTVTAE